MATRELGVGLSAEALARYEKDAVLRDGGFVHLRAIRPDDKGRLREGFRRLSEESVRSRFFETKRDLSERELRYLTEVDFDRHVALVATLWEEGEERIIGVGLYVLLDEEDARAEAAFTVADEHQDRGIGTLLFDELAEIARSRDVRRFEAEVLPYNRRMLDIFRRRGFDVRERAGSGGVRVSMSLADPAPRTREPSARPRT